MLAPDTILQSRYRIIRQIGEGGMGAVYQAMDQRFDNIVALKESFFDDDRLRKAFEREARILNKLRHPALPHVIDYFAEGEGEFLVMQFIPGDDLGTVIEKRAERVEPKGEPKPFDIADVLDWAGQLLDALDYLHTHQPPIIHRDIKPQNLKLAERGQIILLDFGLAKGALAQASRASTSPSIFGYTPSYAPLEQIQGTGTDPRSDLYSLAATLYHFLTGVKPNDALIRATALVNGQPDPLRSPDELNPRVTPKIAAVIICAMAQSAGQRPSSASEMRRLLNEARKPESRQKTTVVVPRQSRDEQVIKDAPATQPILPEKRRRSRLWLFMAIVLIIVLIAGFIITRRLINGDAELESFEYETVKVDSNGRMAERRKARAKYFTEDLGNGVMLEMVEIPGGSFLMGSPDTEKGRYEDEGPQHRVNAQTFFLGKFEVTQAQWRAVAALPKVSRDLDPDLSHFKGSSLPVDSVSWEDAVEFCARLSQKTGRLYRLPTEAEWEYACRAGTLTPFHFGETITPDLVNYDGNRPYDSGPKGVYREKTAQAGELNAPNPFGLYDMHGNVWEWCSDAWHPNYEGAPTDGSAWEDGGDQSKRVMRGGSWMNDGFNCRSATRLKAAWGPDQHNFGFRLAVAARQP